MNHVPDICISICGAMLLVSVPLVLGFWRMATRAPLLNDWRPALFILAALLLALAAPLTARADDPPELPPLLFIITGQSNAGQNGRAATLTAPDVPGAYYYAPQHTRARAWLPMRPYGGAFGVELSFARAVQEATGRTVLVVKLYSGGTSIIAWQPDAPNAQWKRDMATVGNGTKPAMYPRLRALVAEAQAAWGGPVEVAGVVWVQNERDSRMGYGAARYEANLRALIAALRADYGEGLPFVAMDTHTRLAYDATVHEAIMRVAESTPGVQVVPTRDLPVMADSRVHFDSAGLTLLGQRYAAAWEALEQ